MLRWHVRVRASCSPTRSMKNTIVHHEGAAPLEVAVNEIGLCGSVIKIGLDVHARLYVAVAQYDQLLPKPARRLAPIGVRAMGDTALTGGPHGPCGL